MHHFNQQTYLIIHDLTGPIVRFLRPLDILQLATVNKYHYSFLQQKNLIKISKWDCRNIRHKQLTAAVATGDLDIIKHAYHKSPKGTRTWKRFRNELDMVFKTVCVNGRLDIAYLLWTESCNTKFKIRWYLNDVQIIRFCCESGQLESIKWILGLLQKDPRDFTWNNTIENAARRDHYHIVEFLTKLPHSKISCKSGLRYLFEYGSGQHIIDYINLLDEMKIFTKVFDYGSSYLSYGIYHLYFRNMTYVVNYFIDMCVKYNVDVQIYLDFAERSCIYGKQDFAYRFFVLANNNQDISSNNPVLTHFPNFDLSKLIIDICCSERLHTARWTYALLKDKLILPFNKSNFTQRTFYCFYSLQYMDELDFIVDLFDIDLPQIQKYIEHIIIHDVARHDIRIFKILKWYWHKYQGKMTSIIEQFICQHKNTIF